MLNETELLRTIQGLEQSPTSYNDCEKLAIFYILYDHLYGDKISVKSTISEICGNYGDSDFFYFIEGKETAKVMKQINELIDTVQALYPSVYDVFIQKIKDL